MPGCSSTYTLGQEDGLKERRVDRKGLAPEKKGEQGGIN